MTVPVLWGWLVPTWFILGHGPALLATLGIFLAMAVRFYLFQRFGGLGHPFRRK